MKNNNYFQKKAEEYLLNKRLDSTLSGAIIGFCKFLDEEKKEINDEGRCKRCRKFGNIARNLDGSISENACAHLVSFEEEINHEHHYCNLGEYCCICGKSLYGGRNFKESSQEKEEIEELEFTMEGTKGWDYAINRLKDKINEIIRKIKKCNE